MTKIWTAILIDRNADLRILEVPPSTGVREAGFDRLKRETSDLKTAEQEM